MESFRGAEILIFKAETDRLPDPYVDELEKCGFRPKLVPVITFQFFDLHTLKEKLDSPEKYCGMVLSSERCVEAVKKAAENSTVLDLWRKQKFAVCAGEATALKAKEKLSLDPLVGDKHRAEGIIELLAQMNPLPKCVLYPCGELAAGKDSMASGLAAKGIKCEPVPVYKTEPNPELKEILAKLFLLEAKEALLVPKILVFFSPSGLKAVLQNLENCEDLNSCKFASIGPTTSTAIRDRGFSVWAEAEMPNPNSLRIAIEKAADK